MLARHSDWDYRKIATNNFVLVGPELDPANVRSATDVTTAFSRIAAAGVYFISRGDGSGTHERESELWEAARTKPDSSRLLVSGAGMGATLRQADERGAYTLTDDATFMQLHEQLTLAVLFSDDARLVNSYSVVYRRGNQSASTFAEWLAVGNGRELIDAYRISGTKAFTSWPNGCPADQPTSAPCKVQ